MRTHTRRRYEAAGLRHCRRWLRRSPQYLVQLGERCCRTPEDFKAWSQNLGHEGVLTTFSSYGEVSPRRQGEIIRGLGLRQAEGELSEENLLLALRRLAGEGRLG